MKFKTAYLITIILSFFGIFFLIFLKDKMIYLLYGYDLSIMGAYTAEAFQAVHKTYFARFWTFITFFGITVLCFVLSCIAIHRRIYLSYYLTHIALIFSLLLSLFYGWLFILSLIVPRGMLG